MKIAIMESVVTPGGHEIDYDRILVEELTALGHQVEFYVPEGHQFKLNYNVPVHTLSGAGVSYQGKRGLQKLWLSAKRELRRQNWYRELYQYAQKKRFDALIFPSATYRYLRALKISPLMRVGVPLIYIIHGLTPAETRRLAVQIDQVKANPHIRVAVQTFAQATLERELTGVAFVSPPNYIPRDIEIKDVSGAPEVLNLGFFGQYRREKNLDLLLDAFVACNFKRKVKLVVQGATNSEADAADFKRLMGKYAGYKESIVFQHKALIGKEWQQAIDSVDAIVMPYGNERYRYHTSAMLSTAIGFYKPVIIADIINPEVLQQYSIGLTFRGGDMEHFKQVLSDFVNTYNDKRANYMSGLELANNDFSPKRLAQSLADLARGD